MEFWKNIEGFEGYYQISRHGEVKSLNYNNTGKPHILKQRINKRGYCYVNLCRNGCYKSYMIHRLVAQAFIPNPYNLPQVNHKDENKTNNVWTNLEWVDNKTNSNYGSRNKRISDSLLRRQGSNLRLREHESREITTFSTSQSF